MQHHFIAYAKQQYASDFIRFEWMCCWISFPSAFTKECWKLKHWLQYYFITKNSLQEWFCNFNDGNVIHGIWLLIQMFVILMLAFISIVAKMQRNIRSNKHTLFLLIPFMEIFCWNEQFLGEYSLGTSAHSACLACDFIVSNFLHFHFPFAISSRKCCF